MEQRNDPTNPDPQRAAPVRADRMGAEASLEEMIVDLEEEPEQAGERVAPDEGDEGGSRR